MQINVSKEDELLREYTQQIDRIPGGPAQLFGLSILKMFETVDVTKQIYFGI